MTLSDPSHDGANLAADPGSQFGKARKARAQGTRILSESAFWHAIGVEVEQRLFVVRPHAQHFHHTLVRENLIDQSMLDVDPARQGAIKIAHQSLEGRRTLEGIAREDFEQQLDFGPQG